MNEQIKTIIDRARRLLAGIAGTHVNVTLVGDRIEAHRAFHTQSPAIITTLCDALEAAERRAEDARAEQTRHLLLTTVADLKAQKAEAQSAAGRVAIRMLMEDHDPHTYSRCEDRECDHVRLAISALGDDAGRALLDRLTAAEARVADMESVREEQAAKLRRHLDEIAELQERVGLAEGREAAAKANAEQMAGWLDARNAGLVQMARERDALRVKLAAAEAKAARLKSPIAKVCRCVNTTYAFDPARAVVLPLAGYSITAGVGCQSCGGSGAVIVEGAAQEGGAE